MTLMANAGQPIFYRFGSPRSCFYLAVGREVAGYAKLYMYFPDDETVVLL
ncbi:hypothetical protein LDC_0151, partial [sediment metagenome]